MNDPVKVTDSMGDHWVVDGVSIYPDKVSWFFVPALILHDDNPGFLFPTLDAAVDAIHTHLKGGG